jgi:hypothetical protein
MEIKPMRADLAVRRGIIDMVQKGYIVRALIASPSDVARERQIIPEVIAAWNAAHSYARSTIIEPVRWESHAVPLQGDRPQELINQQLVEQCDFLIGVFWTRLGTDTGMAPSGTVEEIEQFLEAGKPVLIYISNQPVALDSVDKEQWEKLKAFKAEMRTNGLQTEYSDPAQFRERLTHDLVKVIDKILPAGAETPTTVETRSDERVDFYNEFGTFVRRITAEWKSDRNTNSARQMLDSISRSLLNFIASPPDYMDEETREKLQAMVSTSKQLARATLGINAGLHDQFWALGDALIKEIEDCYDQARLKLPKRNGITGQAKRQELLKLEQLVQVAETNAIAAAQLYGSASVTAQMSEEQRARVRNAARKFNS